MAERINLTEKGLCASVEMVDKMVLKTIACDVHTGSNPSISILQETNKPHKGECLILFWTVLVNKSAVVIIQLPSNNSSFYLVSHEELNLTWIALK